MRDGASRGLDRRAFMAAAAAVGVGGAAFPSALWARVRESGAVGPEAGPARVGGREAQESQEGPLTKEMIADAARVSGLEFTDAELDLMVDDLNRTLESYAQLREVSIPNAVPPAVRFDPVLPWQTFSSESTVFRYTRPRGIERPSRLEDAAFWPVTGLAELVRTRRVTSTELTEMYLDRLRRHGPTLECVITLTEELALRQAARADAEIARGHYRGPLHGIPWGAKDLLAVSGYRTTWGAKPYEMQEIPDDATVVRRLEEAGAVLVAKLTLGALAQGDVWYGGTTKNPWNLEQGSSGSSAGSASATVAGLVGFAIGSETLGSIVSPSTRCGASGLRPTFGRVSRAGAMALSWSMDKLGPLCRSAEDCALVLHAIHGADGRDPTARDVTFDWDARSPLSGLRVGYAPSAFEGGGGRDDEEWTRFDHEMLERIRGLGIELIPVEIPDDLPIGALRIILSAEAGAAFDELTRSGRDDLLVRQNRGAWPNTFRKARLIPAVEYIQANRVRTMAMERFATAMEGIDVLASPSFSSLLLTNLSGHPQVVIPNGYRSGDGTPTSFSFIGSLYGDAAALRLAAAIQDETDFNGRVPPGFA